MARGGDGAGRRRLAASMLVGGLGLAIGAPTAAAVGAGGDGGEDALCALLEEQAEGALALGPDPDEAFRIRDLLMEAAFAGDVPANALAGLPVEIRTAQDDLEEGVDDVLPALDLALMTGEDASSALAAFHAAQDATARELLAFTASGCGSAAGPAEPSPSERSGTYVGTTTSRYGNGTEYDAEGYSLLVSCGPSTCEADVGFLAAGFPTPALPLLRTVSFPVAGGSVDLPLPPDEGCVPTVPDARLTATFTGDRLRLDLDWPRWTFSDAGCTASGGDSGGTFDGELVASPVPVTVAPNVDSGGPGDTVAGTDELSDRQQASRLAVARGDRSIVPASLVGPGDAMAGGPRTIVNLVLAGLAVLLLVFPAELFNATWSEHHGRVEAWWGRRLPGWSRRPSAEGSGVRALAATVLAGAVIGGFLDPSLGPDRPSVTLVAGIAISTAIVIVVAARAAVAFRSTRRLPVERRWEAIPSGLVIAAVCVALSRLVDFQPGYLFGLVGGLAFVTSLGDDDEGPQELLAVLAALGLALLAWLVHVPVADAANEGSPGLLLQLGDAALATLFIGGVQGLLVGLVPLQLLPGHTLYRWRRGAWAAVTFVVCFVFLQVLLRPESGYLGESSSASVAVTAALFVGFGVASIAFWGWFRLRPDPPALPAFPPTLEEVS